MTDRTWFSLYEGADLEQGDILQGCPRFTVSGLEGWPPAGEARLTVERETLNAILLSQSCDLANDKIHEVLLAQVVAWEDACRSAVASGNTLAKSEKFRNALVAGNVPGLTLLRRFVPAEHGPSLPWAVVDFHQLFTLPKKVVSDFSQVCGPRLRLLSPYKEHVAQAFARYFMRVGLPLDAGDFVKGGEVKF